VDGRWKLLSTGTADREEAQGVCHRMATIAKEATPGPVPKGDSGEILAAGLKLLQAATAGELTEEVGRAFVDRLLTATNQDRLKSETTRDFLKRWLRSKREENAKGTADTYSSTVSLFLQAIGPKADRPIAGITKRDIEGFRDARKQEVGATTVQGDLRCLKAAFNQATMDGLMPANPASTVKKPPGTAKKRQHFTIEEIGSLLREAPSDEWRTMILLGAFSGLRLGDAQRLTWDSVNFDRGTLHFTPQKTERRRLEADLDPSEEIPMHPALQSHLERLAGDSGGPISPTLAKRQLNGKSGLSNTFSGIVRAAGIEAAPEGDAQMGKRRFNPKTYHSLRHSFVSLMAVEGVSPELRQKLAGHSSEKVHAGYTHHELAQLSEAIGKIPSPVL